MAITSSRKLSTLLGLGQMVFLAALLGGCGGGGGGTGSGSTGSSNYTVGGSVTGLTGTVVLQNNGADNLTVSATGSFSFATSIANGSTYSVSVLTQPSGQTCSVSTGAGTVSGNNVSNVAVVCATNTYNVGGTVSGLAASMVLQDNSGDNLTVTSNGTFTFATKVANGSPYVVTILNQPTSQNCSVAGGTGTISLANVTNVSITCGSNANTIGGTVTGLNGSMVLQNNGADNLNIATNGPFTFASTVPFGLPYSVSKLSLQYPNQTCTISGGSGTVPGNVINIAVNCVKNTVPRYAYTANSADNTVSSFVVNNSTGRLKFIGKVAAGTGPMSVTLDPSGKYAYVANGVGGNISQYSIASDGSLTPLAAAATVASGSSPKSVVIDPTGRFAYVANNFNGANGNSISQYSIGISGELVPMTPATVPAGTSPYGVTVDPLGQYVYVTNQTGNTVSQYKIGATGGLTSMTPASVSSIISSPYGVTIDPAGKYAYVAGLGGVSQYTIGGTGGLTPMTPTASVTAGTSPISITVDTSGHYAYVANFGSGNVSQFTIDIVTGALAPMIPATVTAGSNPTSVTVDPSGKYAYVANSLNGAGGNSVSQYNIVAGGLVPITPATVADAAGPTSITVLAGNAAVQAVPQYAYVADYTKANVSQYSIAANGELSFVSLVSTGKTPTSFAVSPSGRFVYAANYGSNNVSQYSVGAGGALTAIVADISVPGALSIAVDPAGQYAYITNFSNGFGTTVSQYNIGTNGALTAMSTPTVAVFGTGVNAGPYSVTVDPSGKYVYVANQFNISAAPVTYALAQYTIGVGGALTPMSPATVVAGAIPTKVAVDPTGRYAYVANSSGSVSQYAIGANGALTAMSTATVAVGSNPNSIAVDPSGQYAYVVNAGGVLGVGASISQFTIGAGGSLAPMASATVATAPAANAIVVDPTGQFAYVTSTNYAAGGSSQGVISQYSIVNGALIPMANPTVSLGVGTGPSEIIITNTWQ